MNGLAYVALLFIGSAFVVAMLNSWRNGVYFFLAWLLFEDFARKYLGNNMAIYFAKDVLVAVVYLSFFLAYRRKRVALFRPPFLVPLLLFVWFGVMQTFNPASTSLIFGVLGLKLFFYYVPLLFVVGFLGYLLLRRKSGRNLAFLALVVTSGAIVLEAARGVLLWGTGSMLVFAVAFVWGAPWRQREVIRVFRTVQRAALGISLGLVLLFFAFPEALLSRAAFYTETLLPSSSASELQVRTWDYPVNNFLGAFGYERWPYGYGIGTLSLGTQYVARIFHVKPPIIGVESGFGTIVLEMGVGGLILWFVMSFAILFSAWQVVKKLRGSPWFPLAFVIFWYAGLLLLPMTFSGMQPYEDSVLNAYLWLLLGILFRLPTLAVSAQYAATAQSSPIYDPQIQRLR